MRQPALLDSGTWDTGKAGNLLAHLERELNDLPDEGRQSIPLRGGSRALPLAPGAWLIALGDGQRALLARSQILSSELQSATVTLAHTGAWQALAVTSAALREILPASCPARPRALGAVPRLGIGSRTTVLAWPSVFRVLGARRILANPIQNSVGRELLPLADLQRGLAEETFLPGLGLVSTGHTGSSVEGLWLEGVLGALLEEYQGPPFGADADHLPLHRPERMEQLLQSSRCYTFFTLDVGNLINWNDPGQARWRGVVPAVSETVASLKRYRPEDYDLEISIDESPPEVPGDLAATTGEQLGQLLTGLNREGIHPQYIAPHLGITKGQDLQGGPEMRARLRELLAVAEEAGIMLDVHSGDDLSRSSRQMLGSVSQGRIAFKIAPILQSLLAKAMVKAEDPAFLAWWKRTAVEAKRRGEHLPEGPIDPDHPTFRHWGFACFSHQPTRGVIYSIGDRTREVYDALVRQLLNDLIEDLQLAPGQPLQSQ